VVVEKGLKAFVGYSRFLTWIGRSRLFERKLKRKSLNHPSINSGSMQIWRGHYSLFCLVDSVYWHARIRSFTFVAKIRISSAWQLELEQANYFLRKMGMRVT
jgi:hypothetical protein